MTAKFVFDHDRPLTFKSADKADPEVIGKALTEIAAKHKGELTPHAVIAAAKAPSHPLHKHFEWSDKVAADKYRLDQARTIIRAVKLLEDGSNANSQRAFLSITDRGGTSYRTLSDVLGSADLQRRVMENALRDLQAFEHRYKELDDICLTVRQARERLADRLNETKHESRASA
jgi:hypothetical protein